MHPGARGEAVVGLDDLLRAGMRQSPVTAQDAEAACLQILFAFRRNAVTDCNNADGVAGAAPAYSVQRGTHLDRAIDVGELVDFDVSRRLADARKHAKIRRERLF